VVVGDLFSGIGGFSLAAHWMGWRTAWFSEIDPYASRVLAHHWPDVPNHGDIRAIDWTTVELVDVLTGGFPCQPHSLAGLRAGSNDERDLFDEIIRCAGVLRPRVIVLENVPGLFTSDAGRFFGRVLGAVAALGYDAEWRVLSAADVGAPHKRERVWIVAHANGGRREQRDAHERQSAVVGAGHVSMGDAEQPRLEGYAGHQGPDIRGRNDGAAVGSIAAAGVPVGWSDATAVRGADDTVRLIPREAATCGPESPLWPVAHGVSGRVARLRGIGNSIVPACALEIFRAIEGRESMKVAA
jgi:DNA (cytosine-5)-methyltransferase 1